MDIVQLAAGVGSRLGKPFPKPLTRLANGETMLARQQRLLAERFPDSPNHIVVGFKKDMIMEEFPSSLFIYNRNFGETNTAKSLLRALVATGPAPVLWLNGDVVFARGLVDLLADAASGSQSFVCVNTESVGDEEVKYTVDADGMIKQISKEIGDPLGEAVGINFVSQADKTALVEHLERCDDGDYFERGIETAIAAGAMRCRPLDISEYPCVEVDSTEDLERAINLFS